MAGIGQSALEVGDFGYYERHVFVTTDVIDPSGSTEEMIAIQPVDPASAIARAMQQTSKPGEFQHLREQLDKLRKETESAPVALVGIRARAGHEALRQRYGHLFESAQK